MLQNYFKSALRFLRHNLIFVGINIAGLSIALSASFIIVLFVINEFSYDRYNTNINQIFRVLNYNRDINKTTSETPYILAASLKEDFPQIEKATNIWNMPGFRLKINDDIIMISNAIATNSEIFDIFTLPLIEGSNDAKLLDNQNSIFLSHDLADKIFLGQNPIGREIEAIADNLDNIFIVNGVYENIPQNSTLKAQCFISNKWAVKSINKIVGITNADNNWSAYFLNTWVKLAKDCDVKALESSFRQFEVKHLGEKPHFHYSLQNLGDVYFGSDNILNPGVICNKNNVRLFSAIAFLIILVAAINYLLLSTAISTRRGLEIGIRKTFGAINKKIKIQLLGESVLLALIALPISYILMSVALPYASVVFQTKLQIIPSNILIYACTYLTMTIIIGIVSGLYTSSYLSSLKIIEIFNNAILVGRRKQTFRSLLIVVQLAIFCSFVSSALIIRSQYKYLINQDLGHFKNDILMIEVGKDFKGYTALINAIKSIPNVISATGSMYSLPMDGTLTIKRHHFQDISVEVPTKGMFVSYDFLNTMGITLLKGRDYSPEFGSDLDQSVIINETAVKRLGITDDPLGKKLGDQTIVGIVKDFNIFSLRSDIQPVEILLSEDKYIHQIEIRYEKDALNRILPQLKNEWKKVSADRPFIFTTIEALIKNQYTSEKNLSSIISVFAFFSSLIAAFGLFGLTLFVSRSRIKEIGIRKAFGSSENAIIYSFLSNNLILVVAAILLSIPIVIYLLRMWLNNFAFKTNIAASSFIVSCIIAAIIVFLTVSIHAYRASRINPVEALRHE
jgi:putative ABC transport system permease protein